jgi:hypothetical protein
MANQRVLFPEPAMNGVDRQDKSTLRWKNVRLPWIHNNESVAFHSLKMLPSINHVEVPLW